VTRYADRLLATGERVVLRGRQHILAPFLGARMAWLIFLAALAVVVLDTRLSQGAVRDVFGWFGLVLLLVALAWLGVIYLDWYNQDYLVTNRRVIKVEGILRKRSADSSLEKINDAVLEQSVLGRMFGYGDLDILTAAELPVDRYRFLSQAQTFKRVMLDEKHLLEQEVFQIPAPPLRAAAPAGAMTPATAAAGTTVAVGDPVVAPPAPAAEPAPVTMTSKDITRALGDLADLRDRGAISPDDYEAKKQELLERL